MLAEDWEGIVLNAPTNVAFAGAGLDIMVGARASARRSWRSAAADVPGLPLRRPEVP